MVEAAPVAAGVMGVGGLALRAQQFADDFGVPARGRDDSTAALIASEAVVLPAAHGDRLPRLSTPLQARRPLPQPQNFP
jgi:hypothetical protein